MEDMASDNQEETEIQPNPFVERLVQFRDQLYQRTLYRAIQAFEAWKNRQAAKRKIANGIKLIESNLF